MSLILKSLDNKSFQVFIFIFFLSIFLVFAEVFSISLLVPLVNLFTGQNIQILNFDFEKLNNFNFLALKLEIYITLLFLFFFIFKSLIKYFFTILKLVFFKNIKIDLKKKIFKSISQNFTQQIKLNPSQSINLLREDVNICVNAMEGYINVFTNLILIVSLSLGGFLINPEMFFVGFLIIFLFYLIYYLISKTAIYQISVDRRIFNLNIFSQISKIIHLYNELKVKKKLSPFFLSYIKNEKKFEDIQIEKVKYNILPRITLEVLLVFSISCLLLFSFIFKIENNFSVIILFTAISLRLFPSCSLLYSEIQRIKFGSKSLRIIKNIIKNHKNNNQEKKYYYKNINQLGLKNLSFSYGRKKILSNIDLDISGNKKICIFGKNGSGKSTLIKILVGILKPSSGQIIINKNKIDTNISWTGNIGLVSQNPYFFKGTIVENIFFTEKIGKKDLNLFSKWSNFFNLKYHLRSNNLSLSSIIDENANNISGGQAKRIAFIRSMIGNPKILILDEALDSIDEVDQKNIIKKLIRLNISIVMITHDSKLKKYFNKIYELKNEKLIMI